VVNAYSFKYFEYAKAWLIHMGPKIDECMCHNPDNFGGDPGRKYGCNLLLMGIILKMHQRPGGRMDYIMVFWRMHCIWGDILENLLCLW